MDALRVLSRVAHLEGRLDDAARLLGGAQGVLDRAGATCTSTMAVLEDRVAPEQRGVVSAGDELFAVAAAIDTTELFEWVFRSRGKRGRPSTGWDSLTPTEGRVADLVAQGLTNREIGERLFISPGTVKTHLVHMYAKLAMRNRTDVAAEVARRNATRRAHQS